MNTRVLLQTEISDCGVFLSSSPAEGFLFWRAEPQREREIGSALHEVHEEEKTTRAERLRKK